MQIEVSISGWEQECCGAPFRIGDQMTWKMHAASPSDAPKDALPRFEEEHHEQTPPEVPHWDVCGKVVAITGINFDLLPVAGEPHSFTRNDDQPQDTSIASVGAAGDPSFQQYRVVLEVADDADLPQYAPERTHAQDDYEALAKERNQERLNDEVGVLLEALADYAQEHYGNVARIARDDNKSAVTAEPHRPDATAVFWSRSSEDNDGILASVGDGSWSLPASAAGAGIVGEFLAAAVDGRVEEHVRSGEGNAQQLVTEARSADGRSWTAVTEYQPFDAGNGTFAVVGPLWDRVQRGGVPMFFVKGLEGFFLNFFGDWFWAGLSCRQGVPAGLCSWPG